MTPRVIIQMLVCDRGEGPGDAFRALASCEALDYPSEAIEILILDNSPAPRELASILQNVWTASAHPTLPTLTVLRAETNLGFAGGHARLAEEAARRNADYLLLLNEDATLSPTAVREGVDEMEAHQDIAVGQLRIRLAQNTAAHNSFGNCLHVLGFGFSDTTNTLPHFYASGAAVFVRASALPSIGGLFDPFYFLYHEDVDLSWRALLAGWRVETLERAEAAHRYEFSRSMTKFYWMERNRWLTHLTHLKIATLAVFFPFLLAAEAALLLLSMFAPWGKEKRRAYRVLLDQTFWQHVRARRKIVQSLRKVTDKDLLARMTTRLPLSKSHQLLQASDRVLHLCLSSIRAVIWW